MSSKRDYVAIAQVINTAWSSAPLEDEDIVKEISEGIAEHFAEHNPAFDRQRFLKACGVGE